MDKSVVDHQATGDRRPATAGRGTAASTPTGRRRRQDSGATAWRTIFELVVEGEAHSRLSDVCHSLDLPVNLLRAALVVDRRDPVSMRDLARHFRVDASYCTALVDGLEDQGIAERRPHPTDRRIKTVVLTDRGRSLLEDARGLISQPPPAFGVLSPAELRQLRELLSKVAAADAVLRSGTVRRRTKGGTGAG